MECKQYRTKPIQKCHPCHSGSLRCKSLQGHCQFWLIKICEVKNMEFNNLIKKASVAREYSELDIARMDYVEERPDYYDGDIFVGNGCEITDIFESEKTNRKGEPYISRFARFTIFNDKEEEKVSFPITFWQPMKDGVIRIKPQNPLSNLIKFITNDEVNNSFDVDYAELQKIALEIDAISVKVRVIDSRNGYETYGFDVQDIQFKE